MEAPKITYLFGAGASAKTMPVVKQLPVGIIKVINFIDEGYDFKNECLLFNKSSHSKEVLKNELVNGLRELHKLSLEHATVDTYARKLFLTGKSEEYKKLRFFLSLYFHFEQKMSGLDSRYETFLISIADHTVNDIFGRINFLSWNYDLQMEAAHARLISKDSISESSLLFNSQFDNPFYDSFSTKLNGTCAMVDSSNNVIPIVPSIALKDTFLNDLDFAMQYYVSHFKTNDKVFNLTPSLNFAWYKRQNALINLAAAYTTTEVLVVIGYSFPFFNRKVDRTIIQGMSNLKKIYIQDINANNVVTRFLSILPDYEKREIQIIPINDVEEFFLPPEL